MFSSFLLYILVIVTKLSIQHVWMKYSVSYQYNKAVSDSHMNVIPKHWSAEVTTVYSLNSLFSLPVTTLYYYRNSCHRSLAHSYDLFYNFYKVLFDRYNVKQPEAVDDSDVARYIAANFSYKQQIYINRFSDGTFTALIKIYMNCKKMKDASYRIDFKPRENNTNEDNTNFAQFIQHISELVKRCEKIVNDPDNIAKTSKFLFGIL